MDRNNDDVTTGVSLSRRDDAGAEGVQAPDVSRRNVFSVLGVAAGVGIVASCSESGEDIDEFQKAYMHHGRSLPNDGH